MTSSNGEKGEEMLMCGRVTGRYVCACVYSVSVFVSEWVCECVFVLRICFFFRAELMELHKGILKVMRTRQLNGMTLIQLDEDKVSLHLDSVCHTFTSFPSDLRSWRPFALSKESVGCGGRPQGAGWIGHLPPLQNPE